MAKHVTTKYLDSLIGDIKDIEYSEMIEETGYINIVKIINDINKRLMFLEERYIQEIELNDDGFVLPIEGIKL